MTGRVDGRRARGDRRRELLLDAAVAVIARDGAGAVTHRAVAAEAGIPPASAAYYFPTVDHVLVAALTRTGQRYEQAVDDVDDLLRTGADPIATLVRAVRGWQVPPDGVLDPSTAAAEYELYLLAARRPELAPIALGWADRLLAVLDDRGVDRDRAAAVVALVEGVVLQSLLGRSMPDRTLRAALHGLLGGPAPELDR